MRARVRSNIAATRTSSLQSESSLQGSLLNKYLYQVEKYGSQGVKELESGRFRFYDKIDPARVPGEMMGRQRVREWNPVSEAIRTWFQTLDTAGNVRQVRPIIEGPKIHYRFDTKGNYIGNW